MKVSKVPILKRYLFYLAGPILLIGLLLVLLGYKYTDFFNANLYDQTNVFNHIKELSSPRYAGRLAGSEGNQLALSYVKEYFKKIGLEPAGDQGTYYQNLQTMVPIYQSHPYLRVMNQSGDLLEEFKFCSDFLESMDNYGSSGQFQGQLIFAANDIHDYSPEELKDKVFMKAEMQDKEFDYAVDCGVKGVLTVTTSPTGGLTRTAVSIKSKKGKTLPIEVMTAASFERLKDYTMQSLQVEVNQDNPYQLVDTPNVLGKITGSNKNAGYIIISAHIDHLGSAFEGGYFPGAVEGASGIGMMLELARVMQEQAIKPEQTIIFAAWNGEEYGQNGSRYYTDHPLYPLDKTQVIVLDMLGANRFPDLVLDSYSDLGMISAGNLFQYLADSGLNIKISRSGLGDDHAPFLEKGVPAVLVKGNLTPNRLPRNNFIFNTLGPDRDGIDKISQDNLKSTGIGLLNYIKAEIYHDTFPRYLNRTEVLLLILYLIGLIWIYAISLLRKAVPNLKIGRISVETIYYSVAHTLMTKLFYILSLACLIFFSVVFISNIPNFSLVFANGQAHDNFSLYLTLKKSIYYIRSLFTGGLGVSARYNIKVIDVLPMAFIRSLELLGGSLIVSFILGTLKGLLDGFREQGKGGLRTLSTLFALSLPDVLIVILVILGRIYLYQHHFIGNSHEELKRYLVALISLSVIPTVYISRVTATAVQEEIRKDYIKAAKAKGSGNFQLIKNQLLLPVLIKVIDTLGAVLALTISNLIIIEYLTYYQGLVYNLITFNEQGNKVPFTGFALALGLIYVMFGLIFQLAARLINPLRRRTKI